MISIEHFAKLQYIKLSVSASKKAPTPQFHGLPPHGAPRPGDGPIPYLMNTLSRLSAALIIYDKRINGMLINFCSAFRRRAPI